jgi:polyisoprenyl-teichoic acid--peptidoglycan teichoic acid transferase
MEPKVVPTVMPSPFTRSRIILVVLALLLAMVGFWYARNKQAQNIVSGVVSSPVDILKNSDGITNVLLLGIGGEGHEGGDLTDSILLASFNLKNNKVTLIAIPRDVWVDSMKAKINTAYHYGNERREGGGRDLAKSAVAETLGIPVHYALVLDFQGFVKAIDAVGGIDVEVVNAFDDYKYPIPGKETAEPESDRYEHIHFDKGMTHMDGATALKFARSRHALGDEGTDFARAARQEKIILAFRNKIVSTDTLFSSETINKLKDSVSSSIDTDIEGAEQASFPKVILGLGGKDNINNIALTDYLQNPKNLKPYAGQWVLIPSPSLEELQTYVKTKLAE